MMDKVEFIDNLDLNVIENKIYNLQFALSKQSSEELIEIKNQFSNIFDQLTFGENNIYKELPNYDVLILKIPLFITSIDGVLNTKELLIKHENNLFDLNAKHKKLINDHKDEIDNKIDQMESRFMINTIFIFGIFVSIIIALFMNYQYISDVSKIKNYGEFFIKFILIQVPLICVLGLLFRYIKPKR